MAYDLVRQKYPGAPCAIGASVVDRETGDEGRIIQPLPGGGEAVRVRFVGQVLPRNVDPRSIAYMGADSLPGDRPRR